MSWAPPTQPPEQNKISPSILLIILILAVIFFISGLLHMLVRCLLRPTGREGGDGEDDAGGGAFQGQLQQLFHLHDAGVDQAFIDALPVFPYKAIVGGGGKDPFDCAVCLCEFDADDKLRLLPKCSHAFHLDCIDTWLLSHSTCPLCRSSLVPDFSPYGSCSPLVLVLESGGDDDDDDDESSILAEESMSRCSVAGFLPEEGTVPPVAAADETGPMEEIVSVKLGKFRNLNSSSGKQGEGSSAVGGFDSDDRRCYSMGTYEYVMNENSVLQVAIKPAEKKKLAAAAAAAARKGAGSRRFVVSECDCHSTREGFSKAFDPPAMSELPKAAGGNLRRKESFSISKIWLRSTKDRQQPSCSTYAMRNAASFRLPFSPSVVEGLEKKGGGVISPSEFNVSSLEKSGSSAADWDVEAGGGNNSTGSRIGETPSFARRTFLWIIGNGKSKPQC